MAKLEIDFVDTKTEGENHHTEDIKPGILYDSTIVQNNVPEAMKGECENDHFDVEGDVFKTELKCEIGNDSESETVICKRIIAEHEVLNVGKTAKSIEIKFENEEDHNEKEENQIGFSVNKSKGDVAKNKENVSSIVQRRSFKKHD